MNLNIDKIRAALIISDRHLMHDKEISKLIHEALMELADYEAINNLPTLSEKGLEVLRMMNL